MRPSPNIESTRTDAGRKIDSWRFTLPDRSKLEVHIHLHSSAGEIHFTSQIDHPVFRHLKHRGTDLSALRGQVEADVHEVIEHHWGADWRPAVLVEFSYKTLDVAESRYTDERKEFSFTLMRQPVRINATRPPGNDGLTELIARETPFSVLQRSHRDRFNPEKGMDADNMRLRRESGSTVSRTVLAEDLATTSRLEALDGALQRFSAALGDRMSPQRLGAEGPPDPADLVEIMRLAADPDAGIDVPPVPEFYL